MYVHRFIYHGTLRMTIGTKWVTTISRRLLTPSPKRDPPFNIFHPDFSRGIRFPKSFPSKDREIFFFSTFLEFSRKEERQDFQNPSPPKIVKPFFFDSPRIFTKRGLVSSFFEEDRREKLVSVFSEEKNRVKTEVDNGQRGRHF